ncbi:PDZ domain-containing protein [Desulfopila inferna]|uniref:PDZ domain-containing protein n=1 Tax=Desulfopila inferna TaxID=468528 RepID=UPI001963F7BA|nr:PDZ domain-containing protein [Desulfopila inferna]
MAILADKRNGRQFLFHEGSTYDGMTIREILPDGITYTSAGGEGAMKLGRSPSPAARALQIPSPQPASSSPAAVRRGERYLHYTLSRQKAASALSNPEEVVKAVEIAEGRLLNHKKGFRISSIETGSVFEDLGLHGGDLVLQVNGRGVSGKEGLRDIVQAIQGESSLDLTVRRRARTYQLGVSIR